MEQFTQLLDHPYLFVAVLTALLITVLFTKRNICIGGLKITGEDPKEAAMEAERITKERVKTVMQMRYELVFRQLKYAENALEKVTHRVTDDYAAFLEATLGIKDAKEDWAWEIYRCKVERFVRGNLIAGLRKVYQENHITEKSELEWLNHKNHITETIRLDLASYIDDNFYACHGLTRKQLEDFHEARWESIAQVIRDCLDNARVMAKTTYDEIQQIKKSHKVPGADY